jgi:hypothetical protein
MSELNLRVPIDGNIVRMILDGRTWLKKIDNYQYQLVMPLMVQQPVKE